MRPSRHSRRYVGGGPLRRYARLVGAPNSAPSLRSVAGLLLALALQSAYEDTLTSLHRFVTAAALHAAGFRTSCHVSRRLVPPSHGRSELRSARSRARREGIARGTSASARGGATKATGHA